MKKPISKIGVIIIHYGKNETTLKCIASVVKPKNTEITVFVIDNTLNFKLLTKLSFNVIIIKPSKNIGYPAAVNKGIREANKYGFNNFLVLNNDVRLKKNFFNELIKVAQSENDKIIIAPLILDYDKNIVKYGGGAISKLTLEGNHYCKGKRLITCKNKLHRRSVDFFTGAIFFIPFNTFVFIGDFREDFFLYYSDLDYSIRALNKKVKIIFSPNAIAYHSESLNTLSGKNFPKFRKIIYYYRIRNKIQIIKSYDVTYSKIFASIFLLIKILKYFVGFTLARQRLIRKIVIKGIIDGIKFKL